jgi:dolichol-phosphate mannosyltransferase
MKPASPDSQLVRAYGDAPPLQGPGAPAEIPVRDCSDVRGIALSVVAPVRDEEDTVPELVERLVAVLKREVGSFEILLVTDENRDNTLGVLRQASAADPRVRVLKLTRSFGQHMAVLAGLHHVRGEVVVIMDGDLEDLPEDIPLLLAKLKEGWQIAYGVREQKNETAFRNLCSAWFNRIINSLSDAAVPHNTCMFRAVTRRVKDELLEYREHEPALTGLMSLMGFAGVAVPVNSAQRHAGESKYNLVRMINLAISFILSFSTKPIRMVSVAGMVISAISFFLLLGVVIYGLRPGYQGMGFLTVAALVIFFGGIQLLAIGLIGEYVGRVFLEAKQRPRYTIDEKIGFE